MNTRPTTIHTLLLRDPDGCPAPHHADYWMGVKHTAEALPDTASPTDADLAIQGVPWTATPQRCALVLLHSDNREAPSTNDPRCGSLYDLACAAMTADVMAMLAPRAAAAVRAHADRCADEALFARLIAMVGAGMVDPQDRAGLLCFLPTPSGKVAVVTTEGCILVTLWPSIGHWFGPDVAMDLDSFGDDNGWTLDDEAALFAWVNDN